MALHEFDPGPVEDPFAALARDYPGTEAYPAADFRVEWGPLFHRGRLDGSARVLVVGQDPGQHESVARRILVGEAGQRVQGFLRKLGIDRSYVMVNAYLYSVYGQQAGERHAGDPAIAAYRRRWLDAIAAGGGLEAVVAFGHLARRAVEDWRHAAGGAAAALAFEHLTHPTMPEASSGGDAAKAAAATKRMLAEWNGGLQRLHAAVAHRDADRPLVPYGDALLAQDRAPIPEADLPAGTPPWMRSVRPWAERRAVDGGTTRAEQAEAKRATVVVTVPVAERPWHT